jgi:type VI secretion system secreted protein VgrG
MTRFPISYDDAERVTIRVAGQPLDVVSMLGEEGISQLFRFDVVCRVAFGAERPEALLAMEAEITLRDGFGAVRTVHGVVSEASIRVADDTSAELRVTVRPHAYMISLGRDSRVFQHETVIDIVRKVIARSAQNTRWEVVGTYAPHEYCAQYREDDWSFIQRMLAEEGIHFWFDHEDGATTMVFDDDSRSAPDLHGGADIVYAVESGMSAASECIDEIGLRAEVAPSRFTVGSFNPQKPQLRVTGSSGDGPFEVYDAPGGGPDTPEQSRRRAEIARDAAVAGAGGIVGVSSSVRLVPGMVMSVVDHPFEELDCRCLVTRARYEARQRRSGPASSGGRPYTCYFESIPHAVPFRPPTDRKPAKQAGLQSGVVVGAPGQEIFPGASGCVRVQLRWDREGNFDDKAGRWMRVAQRGAEESLLLPRVGFNVLTYNEEGDVDAPSVLSRIHDAEHPPTYALPAHKTRVVWKTATSPGGGSFNEIHFEDQKGKETLFMNASKDMTILAQQVKSDSVARDSHRWVGQNHALTVGSDWTENVMHDQSVTIGADESIDIGRGRLKEVKENEVVQIGGNRKLSAGYQHTIAVTKNRNLKVGSAIIDVTTGSMATVAGQSIAILVGGVDLQVANSISSDVGGIETQIVGGVKVELSGSNILEDTGMKYQEKIGGTMLLKSGSAFLDGSVETAMWTVGGALQSSAPEVYVEANEKIVVKCGNSVMTITPNSILIESPSFDLSGAELKIETLKVEHN